MSNAFGSCAWLRLFLAVISTLICGAAVVQAAEPASARVADGLVVLYDFSAPDGSLVHEASRSEQPLELRITNLDAARYSDNGLEFVQGTLVRSESPARGLMESVQKSGEFTLEVWLRPNDTKMTGPARIVTLSRNSSERNFTLGQDGDKFEVRLRTTKTTTNGMPALASQSKSLRAAWTHVVYTFDRAGKAKLYIDGSLNSEQSIGGTPTNWDGGFQLALGNEVSGDRPWLGTLRLVAIYARELTSDEVEQNFRVGMRAAALAPEELHARQQRLNATLFETRIAPLISQHCLECHDTLSREGQLDLSRKSSALQGGDHGVVLVPEQASQSALWKMVSADEMPHDRPPLSASEKAVLKQWIDDGATWSLDVIDPAVYAHGAGSQAVFVQRLTVPEYIETVRSSVGVDIAREARELLPRDLRADGFSNTAYNLSVDLGHVEAYAKLAELIVAQIDVPALVRSQTKSRELTDENVRNVIEPLGRKLLRAPLSDDEVVHYCGISTTVAAAGGTIDEAMSYILEAMLQSPRFIYRIEQQPEGHVATLVNQYELASRLSYIVWGGPPDDELLNAAEQGRLNRAEVESQVRRMLQDRRAVERSRQFVSDWLNLGRLGNLRPDPQKFPRWDPRLAADMREETLAYFEDVVWTRNRPLHELMNSQVTFATPRLAQFYNLPESSRVQQSAATSTPEQNADALQRYDLSNVPSRGGLLTQGSVLTVGGDEASMVSRGLFMMHELLRGVVRDPPPGTDTSPTPSKPGLTQRMVSELRIANQSCVGCHAKFEPLAVAFEKFDGLGSYHERDDYGNALRGDGSILFPGDEKPFVFKSAAELMELLANSERVRETLTWKVTQFALGRPLGAQDAPTVVNIHRASQEQGGTYASLMTAIVTSDLVMLNAPVMKRESSDLR